jgi:hypothetical protein
MPDLLVQDIDATLYASLTKWAAEQGRPVSELARNILAAAERCRDMSGDFDDRTVRDIRRNRDSGCGLCDELDPLFAPGYASAGAARDRRG